MAVNTEVRTRKENKTVTKFIVLALLAFAMCLAMFSMPSMKTEAAGLKVVNSCQGLTVKQYDKKNNIWWTYQGNTRVSYTGIAENEYGWWRTVNGKVDFKYTGIAKNDHGWYRIVDGKVRFDNTGVYKNEYGWWYCLYGRVDFDYTGMKSNNYGSWRIEGGKVNFKFNGLAPDENNKWYYFVDGKVDYSFTGIVKNNYGTWLVQNGVIDFSYNGTYRGYTIKENKVVASPTGTQANLNNNNIITDSKGNVVIEDKGIVVDISKWNGDINFGTMKKSGVKGVMMRAAYSASKDIKFDRNAQQCEVYGIDYGVYHFATFHYKNWTLSDGSKNVSKATSMKLAKYQVDTLLSYLKGKKITGYVCLDLELEGGQTLLLNKQELTDVANYWCDLVEQAGYKPMIYCSVSWMQNNLIPSQIHAPFWVAYYNDTGSYNFPKTGYGQYMDSNSGKITMWQYTDQGNGAKYGTESEYIDLNRLYHSFTGETK